eukprot:symbB.v1.2.013545.t1/scaffold952.1/size217748/3
MANVGVHVISSQGGPDSVFERLGGQPALEKFVDGFYDLMATDRDTKKFFENRNLKNLKKRTVDYLGGLWGGDAYRGPDLFLAHTGLGVTVRIFEVMMKCAEKQLKVMKVKSALSKEILEDLKSMKEPLCDPTGRLAKERHAKNLALGDPFDDAANRAAYAAKQQEEQERRKKIAEFRKKKQQEAKEKEENARKDAAKAAQAAKQKQEPKEPKPAKKGKTDSAKKLEPEVTEEVEAEVVDEADASAGAKEEVSQSTPCEEIIHSVDSESDCSDGSEDSAMNAHLQLLQDVRKKAQNEEAKKTLEAKPKRKLETWARSGDSGLMSLETTLDGGAMTSAWSEGRAATNRTVDFDVWSSIPQDFSVEALPEASYCELMDWRVSGVPKKAELSESFLHSEDLVDQPRQSSHVRLLLEL